MAIASASTPTFSPSFRRERTDSARLTPPFPSPSIAFTRSFRRPPTRVLTISSSRRSHLNSSKSSGSANNGEDDVSDSELTASKRGRGLPVYVVLPASTLGGLGGVVGRRKTVFFSMKALAAAGVEGIVMELWWGLVERKRPGVYDWDIYLEIVDMAKLCRLKVKAVLGFHQCGTSPQDSDWVPLPSWVIEEFNRNQDLAYSDRFGRRNMEYISLGCDILPVLQGRSPLQAYVDFMLNFRDTFRPFLGDIITGIQVGMGPAGELRYPSCPSRKLAWSWRTRELGEFQCYDKYMLASLNACAHEIGMREWGNGGPFGTGSLMHDPEHTEFFKGNGGSWNTPYGKFFLEWYSGMLLLHGERICREAESIFQGTKVNTSAKVALIHWHYGTQSHPSELTAGYYNTSMREGYLPIVRMFRQFGFTLCCPGFEMQDVEEKRTNIFSSPERCLRQILVAAEVCDIPVEGENSAPRLDDESFQQVIKMSNFYTDGLKWPGFSFNFVRMGKDMFEPANWNRFVHFVKQMSGSNLFRSKLEFDGDNGLSLVPDGVKVGGPLAY